MITGDGILALDASPDEAEARRLLGYPSPERISPRAYQRFTELWPRCLALLSPRGSYRIVTREEARAVSVPEPAELVAVAVSTIGPALEEEITRASDSGQMLDALLIDAIGSAAAEAAADALNLVLCAAARQRGFETEARVSPGYGGWETARQRELLALLPIASLGISLTAGAMMVPKKSVSFAANLETRARAAGHGVSKCVRCGLLKCRHRVVPAECG